MTLKFKAESEDWSKNLDTWMQTRNKKTKKGDVKCNGRAPELLS